MTQSHEYSREDKPLLQAFANHTPLGGEGGALLEKLGGGAARFPKPLPYFWPKSAIFPYPIYDQTKNTALYLWPLWLAQLP